MEVGNEDIGLGDQLETEDIDLGSEEEFGDIFLDHDFVPFQVQYLPRQEAIDLISTILDNLEDKVSVPLYTSMHTVYVPRLGRIVLNSTRLIKYKVTNTFQNTRGNCIVIVLKKVLVLLNWNLNCSLRNLFYSNKNFFKVPGNAYRAVNDISVMLGCPRECLHIHGLENAHVIGNLRFTDKYNREVNCMDFGVIGLEISYEMDDTSNFRSGADFVLLIEKNSTLERLAEDRFHMKENCIIISGGGQPGVSTRKFLNKIVSILNKEVYAVMDADIYGVKIMSTYKFGSQNLAFDSLNLAIPSIKWLGIRPSDLIALEIPIAYRKTIDNQQLTLIKNFLDQVHIVNQERWVDELNLMIDLGYDVSIQTLEYYGMTYLANVFLPKKIRMKDYI